MPLKLPPNLLSSLPNKQGEAAQLNLDTVHYFGTVVGKSSGYKFIRCDKILICLGQNNLKG